MKSYYDGAGLYVLSQFLDDGVRAEVSESRYGQTVLINDHLCVLNFTSNQQFTFLIKRKE